MLGLSYKHDNEITLCIDDVWEYSQSHDRQLLEWVLEEVVGEDEAPSEYKNLGIEPIVSEQTRNRLRAKQRQLINQKIKSLKQNEIQSR